MRLFAALLLALALTAPAGAADNTITAGTITNSPPLVSYASDGTTLQGVIVDLAVAMSKHLPHPIAFTPTTFDGLIPALQAGRIDVAFTLMNDTLEREKVLDFVDFFRLSTMLLIQKGNPQKITGLESLCGKTVSTVRGSTQILLIDEQNARCTADRKPLVENLEYTQPADARLQLQNGRVAAFLGNSPVMIYLAKTAGGGTIFDVVTGKEYQPVPLGIGIAKSNVALRDELQKALRAIIADGTYKRILENYGVANGALSDPTINGAKS
ncbi:MAG TPA: ABC transporter substrate-binding protein [Candidatus Baltobacteraceae bacterium]|jgi:polar amino acid transport system substrate-binding protein